MEDKISNPVMETKEAVMALLQNPEDIDDIFSCLVTQLSTSVTDKDTLNAVVEYIFHESLRRPGFGVMSAQLCAYLWTYLNLQDSVGITFLQAFMQRIRVTFYSKDEMMVTKLKDLIAFTDFVAQLLMHMRLSDGQTMEPFPDALVKLLITLLQFVSEDTVACISRVLTMTGSTLEKKEEVKPLLNQLFDGLRDIYIDNILKREQTRILLKLLLLKSSNWVPNSHTVETLQLSSPDRLASSKPEATTVTP